MPASCLLSEASLGFQEEKVEFLQQMCINMYPNMSIKIIFGVNNCYDKVFFQGLSFTNSWLDFIDSLHYVKKNKDYFEKSID